MKIRWLKKDILKQQRTSWGLVKTTENILLCNRKIHLEANDFSYTFYDLKNYHDNGTIKTIQPCNCSRRQEALYEVGYSDYLPYSLSSSLLEKLGAIKKVGLGKIVFLTFPLWPIHEENKVKKQYKNFLQGEEITWNEAKSGIWLEDGESYEFYMWNGENFEKMAVKNVRGSAVISKASLL